MENGYVVVRYFKCQFKRPFCPREENFNYAIAAKITIYFKLTVPAASFVPTVSPHITRKTSE